MQKVACRKHADSQFTILALGISMVDYSLRTVPPPPVNRKSTHERYRSTASDNVPQVNKILTFHP
jgi:hypothetical protein